MYFICVFIYFICVLKCNDILIDIGASDIQLDLKFQFDGFLHFLYQEFFSKTTELHFYCFIISVYIKYLESLIATGTFLFSIQNIPSILHLLALVFPTTSCNSECEDPQQNRHPPPWCIC